MTTHTLKRALVAISCVALLAGGAPAMADDYASPSDAGADMLADIFIVRPISLAGSILGAAVFIVTLPFTLVTQSTDEAAKELLGNPLEYTFNRPLGDFQHCGAQRHACGD
jgi:hypothetical protein